MRDLEDQIEWYDTELNRANTRIDALEQQIDTILFHIRTHAGVLMNVVENVENGTTNRKS